MKKLLSILVLTIICIGSPAFVVKSHAIAYSATPTFLVPAGMNFTVYVMGEFSGTDSWTISGDTNTYTNKVTVTPQTGKGYTIITGKFTSEGTKNGTIGPTSIKVNFCAVKPPNTTAITTVKFTN